MRSGWVLFLAVTACGGAPSDDVPPVAYTGALPAKITARALFNTLTVEGSVDGAAARPILVDTGSPMTGVDPSSWRAAGLPATFSTLGSLAVGPLTFHPVPSVPLTECGTSCGPFDVTGVLGGNVLRSFQVALDYQAPALVLGPTAPPSDATGAAVVIPLDLEGGGRGTIAGGDGQVIDVPPTRLLLHATIEGTARTLFLDTGASYTLLRQSLYAELVSDGRAQLTLGASTAEGATEGAVTRTHTLVVGAAQAEGSPVGSVADDVVDNVAQETGEAVDGMLGGSFLEAYYAVVDYGGTLSLSAYTAPDPLADEFVRVPLFLAEDGTGYVVAQAVDPSDAGLVGDVLVDVDGTPVAGLDPDQADRLLRGASGTAHTLDLQTSPGGEIVPETLPVVDVLPLSP